MGRGRISAPRRPAAQPSSMFRGWFSAGDAPPAQKSETYEKFSFHATLHVVCTNHETLGKLQILRKRPARYTEIQKRVIDIIEKEFSSSNRVEFRCEMERTDFCKGGSSYTSCKTGNLKIHWNSPYLMNQTRNGWDQIPTTTPLLIINIPYRNEAVEKAVFRILECAMGESEFSNLQEKYAMCKQDPKFPFVAPHGYTRRWLATNTEEEL